MLRQRDLPREFYVKDALWTVRYVRTLGGNRSGLTDPSEKIIYIRQKIGSKERMRTFAHELLHAIEHEYEIEIPHRLIYRLEIPLVRLIVDNLVVSGRVVWD